MSLAEKLQEGMVEKDTSPHLIVEARAGTGKTTTLIEGLRRVKGMESLLTPSPQQAAVWQSVEMSAGKVQSICFVAFNVSIATELKTRVPEGCDAMTMHSLGIKTLTRAYGAQTVNEYRVQELIAKVLGKNLLHLRQEYPDQMSATEDLVALCKQNMLGMKGDEFCADWITHEELDYLADRYDVELNDSRNKIFNLVPRVLRACTNTEDRCIDYNDMIWLPLAKNLFLKKYDLLLVDEAQDLNKCQQQLAFKSGRRLVLCGDNRQAIYGFAGADSKSMSNMAELLGKQERGCEKLYLTVTRRCGKAIVKEAQKIVPDFEAFETNCDGVVNQAKMLSPWRTKAKDGDMVLCRVNAPLVSTCFKFLKEGRKATIQGRKDIGAGLIKMINKLEKKSKIKPYTITNLVSDLDAWRDCETKKEAAKRNPSESKLLSINDKYECLVCFTEDMAAVVDVTQKIEAIFTNNPENKGIKLSSVHKAKGLEAKNVFILMPKGSGMPHPMAKSAWQMEQEMNLKYVAITRAIETLTWVEE